MVENNKDSQFNNQELDPSKLQMYIAEYQQIGNDLRESWGFIFAWGRYVILMNILLFMSLLIRKAFSPAVLAMLQAPSSDVSKIQEEIKDIDFVTMIQNFPLIWICVSIIGLLSCTVAFFALHRLVGYARNALERAATIEKIVYGNHELESIKTEHNLNVYGHYQVMNRREKLGQKNIINVINFLYFIYGTMGLAWISVLGLAF